jgi:16S rRNA (guanine(966)-N(2))-methyltransferase RsmD
MRVIAGQFRSRRLKALPGMNTRPTPDLLRESLFSILAPQIEGAVFIDVYAGTGADGIEALSRGAAHAIFIERSRPALNLIRENLSSLGLLSSADIVSGKAPTVLPRYKADIVFLDPPYDMEREYAACLNALAENPPLLVIVQHASRFNPPEVEPFHRSRTVKHGDNSLTFYGTATVRERPPNGT